MEWTSVIKMTLFDLQNIVFQNVDDSFMVFKRLVRKVLLGLIRAVAKTIHRVKNKQ